jgi:site-specific DNA-methyltransferase (adenine-specific)
MDLMKQYPDKYFDLAIVDPPYGIGKDKSKWQYKSRGTRCPSRIWETKQWDKIPEQYYFEELFRVSKNQIIWGANYFIDKIKIPSSGWIMWDKQNRGNFSCSDGELAWTSFPIRLRLFSYCWIGYSDGKPGASTGKNKENRIHPTQKPANLYKWILTNYAKLGWKILDTHYGSGSCAVACNELGFNLTASEIDEDYFNAACKRIAEANKQGDLFREKEFIFEEKQAVQPLLSETA